jgi:hypothetical protein
MHLTDEIPEPDADFPGFDDSYRTGEFLYPVQVMTEARPSWTAGPLTRTGRYRIRDSVPAEPELVREIIPGLVVVIPAYKEELAIADVVSTSRLFADRVIVVDDGSPDRTSERARHSGAEVIRLDRNGGKARALLLGLRHARELGCTVAVMLDGDGQHKPRKIPDLVRPVLEGRADLVIGSRFLAGNPDKPSYRMLGQKTLDIFTTLSSGYRCSDSQSGFRALSTKALHNLDFESSGYCVESDMIAHFADRELAITEVPITVNHEVPNRHKMNPVSHGISVLAGTIFRIISRKSHVVAGTFFFALGLAVIIAGPLISSSLLDSSLTIPVAGILLSGAGLALVVLGIRKKSSRQVITAVCS